MKDSVACADLALVPTQPLIRPTTTIAKFSHHDPAPFKAAGILWSCGYVGPSKLQLVVGASKVVLHSPGPDQINVQAVAIPGADAAWLSGRDNAPLGADWGIEVVIGDKTITVAGGERKERIVDIAEAVLGVA